MKKYNNGEFSKKDIDKEVTIYGWVNKRRDMGGVIFVDLRDRSGIIQVVFNRDHLKDDFTIAESLKNEYCLEITGTIKPRAESEINPNLNTGEIELMVSSLNILSESEELPFNIYDDENISEQVALKYRYLDLRRNKLKNAIKIRHDMKKSIRNFFDKEGFYEIDTPILCKSTPEGARDYIVPSRIHQGYFYALPQSPQLFKQILMISGFEKYYQIATCFRDEDLRADRQPEFQQIDVEMSFATEEDVWEITERMIKQIWAELKGIKLPDFPRLPHKEAIDKYGTDKPDTRFELLLQNLTEILKDSSMNVFSNAIKEQGIAKCLVVKNNTYPRNEIDRLTEFVKPYGAKGLAWLKHENDEFTGVIAKNLENEKLMAIKDLLNIENGDLILIVCGKPKVVHASLSALRLKIAKDFNLIPEDKYNFLWITDFPMFEYSETDSRWIAAHHPFTMPKDINLLDDPENCYAKAYDIVCNGYEIASGSVRIHDPKIQAKVFKKLGISDEEAKNKFGFFLEAFKYGAPPHAGIAPGLDRLVMLLVGTDNIKDVVPFPKTQSANDLMTESPNTVDEKHLSELGIKVIENEK